MAKGGKFLKNGTKPKGGFFRKFLLAVVLCFVLALGAAAAGGVIYYNSMLNLITRPEATENSLSDEELKEILGYVPEKISAGEGESAVETTVPVKEKNGEDPIVNVMLIGQHRQKGEDSKLSDTMILCSINKETKTVTLTSFQRDLYVKLPDYKGHECGKNRINVAYNLGWRWAGEQGGMEMLDQLIYENFGVEVDYNVEVGFDAFTEVIDVMGGVEVELTDVEAGVFKLGKGGKYTLNGEQALGYARLRSTDNDFYRTNRQRNVITALINKAKTMSISDLNAMLKRVLPLVITDMSNEEITTLALELLPMVVDLKIDSRQCPMDGTYWFDMIDISGVPSSVILCELEPNREILLEIAENIPAA